MCGKHLTMETMSLVWHADRTQMASSHSRANMLLEGKVVMWDRKHCWFTKNAPFAKLSTAKEKKMNSIQHRESGNVLTRELIHNSNNMRAQSMQKNKKQWLATALGK